MAIKIWHPNIDIAMAIAVKYVCGAPVFMVPKWFAMVAKLLMMLYCFYVPVNEMKIFRRNFQFTGFRQGSWNGRLYQSKKYVIKFSFEIQHSLGNYPLTLGRAKWRNIYGFSFSKHWVNQSNRCVQQVRNHFHPPELPLQIKDWRFTWAEALNLNTSCMNCSRLQLSAPRETALWISAVIF